MIWGVRYLQEARGLDYAAAVMRSASVPIGWIIGCPLLGFVSDRIGRRKPVIVAGAVVLLVCLAWVLYGPSGVFPAYCIGLVAGVASGAAMLPYTVIKEANPPAVSGTATGVINFLNFTFSALLGPVFGRAADHGQRRRGADDAGTLPDRIRPAVVRRRTRDRAHGAAPRDRSRRARAFGDGARCNDHWNRKSTSGCSRSRRPRADPTAVAHPVSRRRWPARWTPAQQGLIVPILVGPSAKIREVAEKSGIDLGNAQIVDAPHSHGAAARRWSWCVKARPRS